MQMGKHAFLIMAYDDERFLNLLLKKLDDIRSDLYYHQYILLTELR